MDVSPVPMGEGRWCVFMISMHCVSGVCIACGLFLFLSSDVSSVSIRVDSLGRGWGICGVCMVSVWAVPINVVSLWYACGRCLLCVANGGVCMVFVWCWHGVLLFGLRVVSFWYRSGVCCHVTAVYGVYARTLRCLCRVH